MSNLSEKLTISLIQFNIFWENKDRNLARIEQLLILLSGQTDLVVLPEMFSTGFSMECAHLAESIDGKSMQTVRDWATKYNFAITGSFLSNDADGNVFNRGFFITPGGESFFYDKRHLFRLGNENEHFKAGTKQLIVNYKGWNISLIICYDLRFPVWSRNVNNSYDVLLCPANWPEARISVWQTLLKARALENLCYVCGANRVGSDGYGINHNGHSMIIDYKGIVLSQSEENQEDIISYTLSKQPLEDFRRKFPVWKDADRFEIKPD